MTDINAILVEREATHGNYKNHAKITQDIKHAIWKAGAELTPFQREALEMIAHKIGRILAGNPNHIDAWRDISGYATLVVNVLRVTDGSCDSIITRKIVRNGHLVDGKE